MTQVKEEVQDALDRIMEAHHAIAVALASRDGLPVVARSRHPAHPDTLCAMAAALLGAAEAALMEYGATGSDAVDAQGDAFRMAVCGVDDEFLVVVVAEDQDAQTTARRAAEELRGVLQGA